MTVCQIPFTALQELPELKQVEIRLREVCHGKDNYTQLFSSIIQGGKRLRPALVILCGSFTGTSHSKLIDTAAAVELIHAASLIHDDVIDCAESRRNKPTISAQWGQHQAVLYGDFLFARAFSLLTDHGLTNILNNMTKAIRLMCQGEIEQFALRFNCIQTESSYMSYIQKKTAFFLSACCQAGAEISDLPPIQQKLLTSFGLLLGYAFQLTDDLLDYCGNEKYTGKPVLHDLTAGYLTLPVIRLLYNPSYSLNLRRIIETRDFSAENMQYIRQALYDTGIINEIQQKAASLILKAKENLDSLPNEPTREILSSLADYILSREL